VKYPCCTHNFSLRNLGCIGYTQRRKSFILV
jgi:hypothetical protein